MRIEDSDSSGSSSAALGATHVISTAGHVDHGKSTLVKALTGIDPDRLAEEQARGLTIDLGFGSIELDSGRVVAIIDVPGHVRFLKNMLAGVGAVDAAIFVVSAAEGWMPQSEEHLRILELLGVRHGLVVLTHIDLVDEDLLELARLDIEEHVSNTFLANAPVVSVDSVNRKGLTELRTTLDAVLELTPQAIDVHRPRLWVDRSFTSKGSGTVVTGTLGGGHIAVDDDLVVEPGTRRVRVRGAQSLYTDMRSVGPGSRVALNLSGIAHDNVDRGDVLVRAGQWHLSSVFDASFQVLADLNHVVSRRGAHVLYLGSGEHRARIRVLGSSELEPGARGFLRIRIGRPYPMLPGDRFVLRDSGRAQTIGGGEILDVEPISKASTAKPTNSVEVLVRQRRWVDHEQLTRLTGQHRAPNVGRWVVSTEALAEDCRRLVEAVGAAGELGLALAELDDQQRALVEVIEELIVEGTYVKAVSASDRLLEHPFLLELRQACFSPPSGEGYNPEELKELVRRGLVVRLDGIYYASETLAAGAAVLADLLESSPGGVTVSQVRDAWNTSRKFAMPLLSHFDATGVTRRRQDLRIAGPRLPRP